MIYAPPWTAQSTAKGSVGQGHVHNGTGSIPRARGYWITCGEHGQGSR